MLIIILLVEMPSWVINFSISLNITLGVLLLMIGLYVQKPLELAAFPSIILIGTMFRLVLGIASTRLILAKGDTQVALKTRSAGSGLEFFVYDGSWKSVNCDFPSDWVGNWHQVAGTYSKGDISIYIDGKQANVIGGEGIMILQPLQRNL
mgnify:CR=1 FL=1